MSHSSSFSPSRTFVFASVATLIAGSLCLASDQPKDIFALAAPKWAVRPENRNAALIYLSGELASVDSAALAVADLGAKNADALGSILDSSKLPKEFEAARVAVNPNLIAKIRSATRLAKCDFEIDYEKGFGATLPGLQNMRNAARLLRIDTRIALTEPAVEGSAQRAVDNLAAMFGVARDTASMRLVISSLVAQRILDLAIHETRVYLSSPMASEKGRAELLAAILDLGADPLKFSDAMQLEEAILRAFLTQHLAAKSPGDSLADALLQMGTAADSPSITVARKASRKEIERAISQTQEIFRAVRADWAKPAAEQSGESFESRASALPKDSVVNLLLPSLDRAHELNSQTQAALNTLGRELSLAKASDAQPQADTSASR